LLLDQSGHFSHTHHAEALYTRDRFVERYAERTGRDMTHLGYHEVLGIFKLAVISNRSTIAFIEARPTTNGFGISTRAFAAWWSAPRRW